MRLAAEGPRKTTGSGKMSFLISAPRCFVGVGADPCVRPERPGVRKTKDHGVKGPRGQVQCLFRTMGSGTMSFLISALGFL